MDLKFKIKCSCHCSYTVSENISTKEISCPNCGTVPSFSAKLIEMLKIAEEIPDWERLENGQDVSIHVLSTSDQIMNP